MGKEREGEVGEREKVFPHEQRWRSCTTGALDRQHDVLTFFHVKQRSKSHIHLSGTDAGVFRLFPLPLLMLCELHSSLFDVVEHRSCL